MKVEKAIARILERLDKVKEMQGIEVKVKREKGILQETAQAKAIEVTVKMQLRKRRQVRATL